MLGLIGFLCGVALYFLPAIIAHHRHHVSFGAIFLINLLVGWSIIVGSFALSGRAMGIRDNEW